MSEEELNENLTELYQCEINMQSWMERKWLPHKHVSSKYVFHCCMEHCCGAVLMVDTQCCEFIYFLSGLLLHLSVYFFHNRTVQCFSRRLYEVTKHGFIFRSTLWPSQRNKAGIKCPSLRAYIHVCPSEKNA